MKYLHGGQVKAVVALIVAVGLSVGCASNPSVETNMAHPLSSQAAVGETQNRAKVHVELGFLYLADGRVSVALDEARLAIAADSSYALAYNLLGLVYMALNDNVRAEENFERAIRLAPGDPEINNNYGWFFCQTTRQRRAFEFFETAARNPLYPTPTKPLTNGGICALQVGDEKLAEDFLLRAVQSDTRNIDAQHLLAQVLFHQGRLKEAQMRVGEVHRYGSPTSATAWLALRIERKLGNREAELKWVSTLRRQFQSSEELRKLNQGRYE